MDNKLLYITNDGKQKYTFCRLNYRSIDFYTNRWADMVLLYSEAFLGPRKVYKHTLQKKMHLIKAIPPVKEIT